MKTLVVLAALVAVAVAGPTSRGDTDLDFTKEKRSPTLGSVHHHLAGPGHILPVHQHYVQPIIPHHLGLKKPLIVHQPYGHHIFRSEEEQLETHSADAKESKKTCMKEMEAKCDENVTAKSSELVGVTKVEDIDGNISDTEVEQSLRMAKEAVDTLQKKLQLAEKNPRMLKWHHGESEADGSMHENVETAKLALEHMERNFGNLESMNVHARAFTNAGVHDANLKLESARSSDGDKLESIETAALKNAAELKSDQERLAQWKDAIENIQKNVELVRNIEDSFQHKELSGKSASLEKSSSLKHEMSDDHKQGAIELKAENTSDKRTSDMKMAQDIEKKSTDGKSSLQAREHEKSIDSKNEMESDKHISDMKMAQDIEKKSTDGKSSWQAREHEKSIGSKNEMETSASTLSETKTTFHNANEQKAFRSETSHLEKSSDVASGSNVKLLAENARQIGQTKVIAKPKELISQPNLKTSENLEMKQSEDEFVAPIVDTTTLMKSAEHHQAEQHKEIQHSSNGHSFHKEHDIHDMNSHLHQSKMSAEHHQAEHSSQTGHDMSSHNDHQKSSSSDFQPKEALDKSLNLELAKAKESKALEHESSISATHGKEAHAWAMKSSDQLTGQSQPVEVAVKPVELGSSGVHSERLHHTLSHGTHGKSAEDGALFAPIEMTSGFKEALVPTKTWKESNGLARGAYGSGAALAGLGGSYSSGYGSGSGAVGVFPSAHVGGCAIPLLLSCSPKVVAGHLAKGHSYGASSYAPAAYRGSESLSSHSKRDITKISRPSIIKRTPTNNVLKQKNILIADKL